MKKMKKFLAFAFALVACGTLTTSLSTVKGSAALVVPDDYEYEDTWDDSYLLDNLDGEQTIKADGTPTGGDAATSGESSGCGSSLTAGGAAILLAPALGALLLKKKRD